MASRAARTRAASTSNAAPPTFILKSLKPLGLVREHLLADVVERVARAIIPTGGIRRDRISPATQEAIQRQAGNLAQEIPESNVDSRDGPHGGPTPASQQDFLIHGSPVALDKPRVLADQQRAQYLFDQVVDGLPAHRAGVSVADASGAVVGVDPHQDILPSTELTCSNSGGPLDWHTHGNSTEIGDLHGFSLMSSKSNVRCRMPLRFDTFQVALEEGRFNLEGFRAVVGMLAWIRMQALIAGAKTIEQVQLPVALKTLIVPLHHE